MKSGVIAALVLGVSVLLLLVDEDTSLISNKQTIHLAESLSSVHKQYAELYGKVQTKLIFEDWCQMHGKQYSGQERTYREHVFLKTKLQVIQHNIQYQLGNTTWFMNLNKFSDLTDEEFIKKYTWKQPVDNLKVTLQCNGSIMDAPNPPLELDWGNKVSKVGDQGDCGMDWAMVATSALQSLYALRVGTLVNLSVQQLLECSGDYGNEGCYGGFMEQAFWYIIDNGIAAATSYPERFPLATCRYVLNMKFTGFTRCARIPSGSYSKLLSAIVQQPVSVAMNVSPDMKSYDGGIYDGQCSSELNHGMLLTGYGGTDGPFFWILKNTIGTSWGINGFMHIKRQTTDGNGKCGMQLLASVPQGLT